MSCTLGAWGLDLAGQMGSVGAWPANLESAGTIGGLLAVEDLDDLNDPNDMAGNFVFLYDANGHVTQIVDWNHDPTTPRARLSPATSTTRSAR